MARTCVAARSLRFSVRSFVLRTFLFSHRKINFWREKSMDENLQQSEVSIIPAETTPAKGQFPKTEEDASLVGALM